MANNNTNANLNLQQIATELHHGQLTEQQAIADANKYTQTHPSSVQSAANHLGNLLSVPGDIATFITSGKNWIRLLEVIAGFALIVMGLRQVTGVGDTVVNVAKSAGKAAAVAA